MDFEHNCYLINSATILTENEKSKLIRLLRDKNSKLGDILSKYNSDNDISQFYDELKNNGFLISTPTNDAGSSGINKKFSFLRKVRFHQLLKELCGNFHFLLYFY